MWFGVGWLGGIFEGYFRDRSRGNKKFGDFDFGSGADFYRLLGVGEGSFQLLSGHSLSLGSSPIAHVRRGRRHGTGIHAVYHASNSADLDGRG